MAKPSPKKTASETASDATSKKPPRKPRADHHRDGSLRAKGTTRDGELDGYWEWFRKDGTKMRSGHFDMGKQTGEWTTYDAKGKPYKITQF
jgi:antitoxin component YwqK of YwqJK toxin-antitoxin module